MKTIVDYKVGDKVKLNCGLEAEVVGVPFIQRENAGIYASTDITKWFWVLLSDLQQEG